MEHLWQYQRTDLVGMKEYRCTRCGGRVRTNGCRPPENGCTPRCECSYGRSTGSLMRITDRGRFCVRCGGRR